MKTSKGFTIIELLVVIAIIAVLAAVVLVNVTQYIAKGKDASIKGNMANMVTIAAAWYDNHSSVYTGVDADATFAAGMAAIDSANGTTKNQAALIATGQETPLVVAGSAFCIAAELNDGTLWCVDSTGYKGVPAAYANCDAATADCAPDA
jgi:type IV pilus assembly protein PilA